MQLTDVTKRGHENWNELDPGERYRAAMWLAHALQRNGLLGDISSDAVAVGAGPRESSAGQSKSYDLGDVVVVVDVEKKRTPSKCGSSMVPKHIQATIPVSRKRKVLAVPTDVRTAPPTPKGQADPFKVRAESQQSPPKPPVNGSFCALVRNTSGNQELRYLLTCHHVAFLSLNDPHLHPDLTAVCMHQSGESTQLPMGKSTRPAKFSNAGSFSIDAGLILLDGAAEPRLKSFWPVEIRGWVKRREHIAQLFGLGVGVWNRRLSSAATTFSQIRFSFEVKYAGGGKALFAQLIEYKLNAESTQGGDSGGALVGPGGILVGMHIAGVEGSKLGFAIPAYSLMRSSAFSPSIEPVAGE